ncbi:MAG TPA: ferric iron uptake transcriptional regulator [Thiobacillaceae bacterium]|nr:ferric iron uptake transcriptional regulator [Thiobacillaceae bacterium]HNA81087.1 ferric iron uptake transcriptional regulator [Thiobacillaceae bacterium]HNF89073.1 ferric iron uptake transcriptional regulator [Thiobacillaceae bacterium]HNH88235.1 ferric iron uptake transcriptional regulator [Thiobacillaceae bacterium]HNI07863.1 ferric iron uptake transcriptional regulator [Thiobacillaceae bacterium]
MAHTDQLKTMGLKVTGPRLKILSLFEQTERRHLTAEDVYRLLIAEHVDVGLATVYRVLTQFEHAGLLIRHHFDNDKAVYELNRGGHHDHLLCLQCGKVEEFYDPEIERRQHAVAAERGYKLAEHALHLYVECVKENCPNRGKG